MSKFVVVVYLICCSKGRGRKRGRRKGRGEGEEGDIEGKRERETEVGRLLEVIFNYE